MSLILKEESTYSQSRSISQIPLLKGTPGPCLTLYLEGTIVLKWKGIYLPLLIKGDGKWTPAFHAVATSLPDIGFLEGAEKKGFGLKAYTRTSHQLLLRLGYEEYFT